MAGCYVAEFIADGQEIDVWFNKQAEWVMTETDVESLEKVPAPVAEAFMSSTMTGMRLRDIRIITFPKHPTVIIIEVEQYNSDEEFQLFYDSGWKTITKPRCNRTWRRDLSRTLFQLINTDDW